MTGTLPAMRRAHFALTLALAAVVAACAGSAPVASPTGGPSSPGPSGAAPPAGTPSVAVSAEPQTEGPGTVPPSATPKPSTMPKPSPSSRDTVDGGGAAACSGTDENRAFFANAAKAVDWTVVCAVLPNRWFVSAGSYRQARGGRLTISYKGPHNATLSLSEGAWCTDADGCVPAGTEVGPASLGPMQGTLFELADGGFAIAVDEGEAVSWLLETQGLDQASTEELGAAAAAVSD
jgi:hypothetical protein